MMGGFSTDWLSLRAQFDGAARSPVLEDRLARFARDRTASRPGRPARTLRVVDLGAGNGNNYRHLSSRLPVAQHWTLVDADPDLLAAAPRTADVTRHLADLSVALEEVIPDSADLVTASALIDLVSQRWLDRLVERVRRVGAALLIVLTYDGRIRWSDGDEEDARVADLLNRHQRGDKGFGPALGPDAPRALQDLIGADVQTVSSDWVIAPEDGAMRRALVDGWAQAAWEIDPEGMDRIGAWAERRRQTPVRLVVGHADQLVLPG